MNLTPEPPSAVAALTACSVRWVVQRKNDSDVWVDLPAATADTPDIAWRNLDHLCGGLAVALARHRVVRRAQFDYLELR